ncbi:MarR family winged helix-turn-helix transcriptional regulator [Corynebacterium variabile]|uniref:MarR family winged helix-turn-helix transcriptional regulator n=1 Tax=Corynebacterium variabile TaxID=1727 RepID=UPI003FD2D5CA
MSDSLPPESSPGLLLWRVTLRWQRQIAAALKSHGLTHVQFVLLTSTWWLTHEGNEQPSQRRVAQFAGTDVMMTSQVLRTLEGKGLLERRDDPADARSKIVSVTPAGRQLATGAVRDVESVDQHFFAPVNGQELLALLHELERD